ncbi:hypothetical protein EM20IM_08655 [Candidatus Methylacidiphilum infernorum]|uniref:Uncharacterized protein n=1 Tax=Candidatus Methylacidiphilum infernorum TaxID=511746 RepID=A0ABX7PUG7_9BACT|nr:hypothetical protein [Candidatus Methylacidiphilum infernorum]QSR86547.1 hypothetical protein EM20IM_08655 [Candidatus Methylacidiphilum infernorum]
MGLLSIPSILVCFYFFASYYERVDIYARLFLTQKPGSPIKEPHVFFDWKYSSVLPPMPFGGVGNLFLPEDPKFPALWVKGWFNGSPVTMRRYPREEAKKIFARHYASSYAEYVWLSEPFHSYGGYTSQIQAEFNVLPDQAYEKIDKFYYIVNGDSDQPLYFSFVLDLGQMFRVIPGIGKTTSPYFLQWLCNSFFMLSPLGYKIFGSQAYWLWQNIHHIDQKIQVEWYAWYR